MIEKLEIKLNELKGKINKKAMGVIVFMVFGAISIFSMEMTNNFKRQKQEAQDSNNKAMYSMIGYMGNVENELAKLQITNTPKLTTTTLASIWKQSNLAKSNLESLPIEQGAMANAAKYLAQLSDFSYSLMRQVMDGEKIDEEQYKSVAELYDGSKELAGVMQEVYENLNDGRIKWDELAKEGDKRLSEADVATPVSSFGKIDKTFQEYEGLIYDGAFSDHLLNRTPEHLSDKEATSEEAKKHIEEIFGQRNIEYINDKEESSGTIDLYNFDVKLKNKQSVRNISITKKDAMIYLMVSDRKVDEEKISMDDAKKVGLEFLKKLGIENVKDTYYLKVENMAIINYAAYQDDVTLYPDLAKVKVALDDGEICSVELQGYIFNNKKRDNLKPKISMEKAREVLNKNIEVISSGLALIPTESMSEVLTYEFKGKINEREFLVYVNAETGQEEKVLLILDTEGGTLTM